MSPSSKFRIGFSANELGECPLVASNPEETVMGWLDTPNEWLGTVERFGQNVADGLIESDQYRLNISSLNLSEQGFCDGSIYVDLVKVQLRDGTGVSYPIYGE